MSYFLLFFASPLKASFYSFIVTTCHSPMAHVFLERENQFIISVYYIKKLTKFRDK